MEKFKDFIAFTTKGLEGISEQELKSLGSSIGIKSILTKRIIFSAPAKFSKKLLKLRTIDDIHLYLGEFEIPPNETDFIIKLIPLDKIKDSLKFISTIRKINWTFSLTLSKYQNDLIDLDHLRKELIEILGKQLDLEYIERGHSNFDIRIHIEGNKISFSCKIPKESLYNRDYRVCERRGALKPTIASSLCLLLHPEKGKKLIDNFCGTGTILCEAKDYGLEIYGGDIDEGGVRCAIQNIKLISPESAKNIKVLDAKKTGWSDSFFDYAISNFPWGKQVNLNGIVNLYSNSIAEYSRILKPDGKLILLGTNPDLIIKHMKKNFPNHEVTKFQIGFLGETPWVVCAFPETQ